MLTFIARYKMYLMLGTAAIASLCLVYAAAYSLGRAHGVNECERKVNAERVAAYDKVLDQVAGWAEQDAADRARWDRENRVKDNETGEQISRVLRELGDISDAKTITVTEPCPGASISYSAVELRNEAAATTGYRARDAVEASAFGFDLEVSASGATVDISRAVGEPSDNRTDAAVDRP